MAHKLTHLSAVELARLVRTKEASPVEVVEAHLAAIQKINPAVNAFCTVAAEKALVWAREAERAVKKRAKLSPCTAFQSRSRISRSRLTYARPSARRCSAITCPRRTPRSS